MCSAYTVRVDRFAVYIWVASLSSDNHICEQHVFADTLRSTAVLIAAGISYTLQIGVPEMVDAMAALAVSLIILFSLGPLLKGIFHAWGQLRRLSNFATRLSEERPILN